MQKSLTRKPIEIKIATVVAIAVTLHQSELSILEAAFKEMTGNSPDFFDDEFAVIDVENIAQDKIDWQAIIALLKSSGLHAVAVRNALDSDHTVIRTFGLSIDVVSKGRPELPKVLAEAEELEIIAPIKVKPTTIEPPVTIIAPIQGQAIPAMLVDTPVRAGQRVYARGCDLIITAAVNNGAEVIADGSIHIYAPLRGRALAGAMGNTNARIFAQTMEAELVSIAGIYRTFDQGFPVLAAQQPVQIKLIGDSIDVSSIKIT
jgi:septum site-determining protein MinC